MGEGPPTPEDTEVLNALLTYVKSQSDDAASWIDGDIAPRRQAATKYYRGDKFGNEQVGRSDIVLTEVRDTIQAMLPSLLRVFFSGEKALEFMPSGPEDIALAEQATDYVNFVVQKDNPGFEVLHAAFKDALKLKTGIVKWWWDTSVQVTTHHFEGLDEQALVALLNEPGVEPTSVEPGQSGFTVALKRRRPRGKVCLAAVPPEEFLVERTARSVDDALYIEHRSEKTASELVAMGYDAGLVANLSDEAGLQFNSEKFARNPAQGTRQDKVRKYVYRESWTHYDLDGDGIDELLKVCRVGSALLYYEPTDEKPFATFCPDPEPHTFFGTSVADATMDIQRIKSTMMRVILDSAVQAVTQRMVVNETVNVADVLNNELGGLIRARGDINNAVRPLETVFLGQQMLPLLGYMDEVKENRTGMSKASMGLDADALQSSTRAAVAATVTASQQKLELIARIFAETGMKRLYRGILRLITRKQDRARMIRLRNEWIPMDPRSWNADMDVTVNVAVGAGTNEERLAFLGLIAAKQEQVMQVAGPENPLVNAQNLFNTYAKMLELGGQREPTIFFTDPSTWQPPPPKPDPAEMLAQIEMEKNRATMAIDSEKVRLDREKFVEEADFKRDELDAKIMLDVKKMELDHDTAIDTAKLGVKVDRDRISMSAIADSVSTVMEPAMEKMAEATKAALAKSQNITVTFPKRKRIPIKDKDGNITEVVEQDA